MPFRATATSKLKTYVNMCLPVPKERRKKKTHKKVPKQNTITTHSFFFCNGLKHWINRLNWESRTNRLNKY